MSPTEVAGRLAAVRERVAAACARAGRDAGEVTLIGASKGQSIERLLAAWEAGLADFGENRVQEALAKAPRLPSRARWHLLGPLQTNKIKKAVGLFTTVHSLDRLDLARALDAQAARAGRRLPCFLEVNLGGEATKHGFSADGLAAAAAPLAGLAHLRIVGLMAIPPQEADPEGMRPWFRRLRELRDALRRLPPWSGLDGLSMGMSADFAVAIEEGATHVRVGTALFGARS